MQRLCDGKIQLFSRSAAIGRARILCRTHAHIRANNYPRTDT